MAVKRILLTGERGTGKTSLCRLVVQAGRRAGWDVAGLISPARFAGGEKTAIEVEDVRSGRKMLLARRRGAESTAAVHPHTPVGVHTDAWVFDEAAVQWGNEMLRQSTPCDLLLVDELGVLELERGQGWTAALQAVDGGDYRFALIVVRPSLLATAYRRWRQAEVVAVTSVEDASAVKALMVAFGHPAGFQLQSPRIILPPQ